jgi:hypothetical protein
MKKKYFLLLFVIAGTLFSGYLATSKFFFGSCPFDSSCPYFLGYPACLYGFGMYLTLLTCTILLFFRKNRNRIKTLLTWLFIVSGVGVIFGGYFSIKELLYPDCPYDICIYILGIPSCVYGWLDFILIFCFVGVWRFGKNKNRLT